MTFQQPHKHGRMDALQHTGCLFHIVFSGMWSALIVTLAEMHIWSRDLHAVNLCISLCIIFDSIVYCFFPQVLPHALTIASIHHNWWAKSQANPVAVMHLCRDDLTLLTPTWMLCFSHCSLRSTVETKPLLHCCCSWLTQSLAHTIQVPTCHLSTFTSLISEHMNSNCKSSSAHFCCLLPHSPSVPWSSFTSTL